ncbi:MAG: succinate dehydrogenase [Deltaproteobacteria bacterium]|nr:succinate dehydrogenase [Deltaproteobacteria bacterium]
MSDFVVKRIHSLLGIFPIGAFLLQHFFSNSYVFISAQAYNEHSEFLTSLPMVELIELSTIYLPIFLHIVLGLAIVYRGRNNVTSYNYFRNWMFFLQRATGVIAVVFIATHSYTTRIATWLAHEEMTFQKMSDTLHQPFWFWFYAIGITSVTFHFCNGVWSFLVTWGITVGPKAQKVSSAVSMFGFVLMTALGFAILLRFV